MAYERSGDTWRNGNQFIRIDVFDDDPDRVEYEVWTGNDASGDWEALSFHTRYDKAVIVAEHEAQARFGRRTGRRRAAARTVARKWQHKQFNYVKGLFT